MSVEGKSKREKKKKKKHKKLTTKIIEEQLEKVQQADYLFLAFMINSRTKLTQSEVNVALTTRHHQHILMMFVQ